MPWNRRPDAAANPLKCRRADKDSSGRFLPRHKDLIKILPDPGSLSICRLYAHGGQSSSKFKAAGLFSDGDTNRGAAMSFGAIDQTPEPAAVPDVLDDPVLAAAYLLAGGLMEVCGPLFWAVLVVGLLIAD
jgi:hypothetical protein